MTGFSEQFEFIAVLAGVYLFLVLVVTLFGSHRKCGAIRAFVMSLLLTPVAGMICVLRSPERSVLKTIHYRCNHCGLEYTSSHRYCHICAKDGHKYRLHRISMKTY